MSIKLNLINANKRCLYGSRQDINIPHTLEQGFSTVALCGHFERDHLGVGGAVLCISGCLAVSLVSRQQIPVASHHLKNPKMSPDIAEHLLGKQLSPVENHGSRGLFWEQRGDRKQFHQEQGDAEKTEIWGQLQVKFSAVIFRIELFFIQLNIYSVDLIQGMKQMDVQFSTEPKSLDKITLCRRLILALSKTT